MAPRDIPPEFYRAAFEHSAHAIVAVDDQRRIVAANHAATKLFRMTLEELIGRSGTDFSLAAHDDQTERLWRILLSGGTFREDVHIVTVDGNHEVLARQLPLLSADAHAAAAGHGKNADVAEGLAQCEAMLHVAMGGLERVRSMVRDLKTFSRIDPEEGFLVDVHQVLDSALNVAQSELRHRALIERHYGDVPPVRGSNSRLGQVFLNLVINGGTVRITTSSAPDGWASIEIADDGVGMSPDARARLFEPFRTTKPGEGTGLGLYITRTIVEAHGGVIEVESTEGLETAVRVKLPPYEPTLDARQHALSTPVDTKLST